ncbi:unnamed protein product [Adineta steineri]|uniref:MYND-type domain-containing protein n=1 Tax=Adineta steineri TaxID=433720 RepID=A0A814EAB0_9BILA|nr:unnamed protein product [Adineta steineri]CAF1535683.1 unnamed protein product [Adineta steineri]CAF1535978.1 unnamed protein product [Adineta steineri]
MLQTGDTNQWDLSTLLFVLRDTKPQRPVSKANKQRIAKENNDLLAITNMRNNNAHHPSKCISNTEFENIWSKLSSILISFGDDEDEIVELKLKTNESQQKESVSTVDTIEAKRLKELGNETFKQKKFDEAIKLFSQALVLPGLSDVDRSILYSNRAAAYLEKRETSAMTSSKDSRYLALQDAEHARDLRQTWPKAHFRVGQAHSAFGEYEKAVHSFNKALALDPTNAEMQNARDSALERKFYYDRQDHLVPQNIPRTTREQFDEVYKKKGFSIQQQEEMIDFIKKSDPGKAAVFTGHQYRDGDEKVEQNYELAARFYSKAVSLGNPEGMYNLALLHQQGRGVKKDMKVSIQLLEQAAAQNPIMSDKCPIPNVGVAEAEHSLGLHYETGVGVEMNYSEAARWYQRAIEHGSANAANNLGLMYGNGKGVTSDLVKSEQLLRLSATRGDSNAPMNLAVLLFRKQDFQAAEQWCQYASENNNMLDKTCVKKIQEAAEQERKEFNELDIEQWEKQNGLSISSLNYNERIQRKLCAEAPSSAKAFSFMKFLTETAHLVNQTSLPCGGQSRVYDRTMLEEYSQKGYGFAQRLLDAQTHFFTALHILLDDSLSDDVKDAQFIQELSASIRKEHIVIQFPEELRNEAKLIVDHVLTQGKSKQSQLDEDARVCFGWLHMNSLQPTIEFLSVCIRMYPKSHFFLELRGSLYGFLEKYEEGLADFNTALHLAPDCYKFLYDRAVMLRLVNPPALNEAVLAYNQFLKSAPVDHRKVPEAYYATGNCYLANSQLQNHMKLAEEYYEKGIEAERQQLPCFLPYESNSKSLISKLFSLKPSELDAVAVEPTISVGKPKSRLSDPRRLDMIQAHRTSIAVKRELPSGQKLIPSTNKPRVYQNSPASLIGLKGITLREMNPMKDHVYEGCILSGLIFEQSPVVEPSLWLLFEDDNGDLERLFIYNIPAAEGWQLVKHTYIHGTRISILNPYMRMAMDNKPAIRVDDASSIILHGDAHNVKDMCRCCSESNASRVCGKCGAAHYCSKECQTMDWKQCGHKLICN